MPDQVDKISTELHNPEVTVPQGSGSPLNNYKLLAALAVMRGDIKREETQRLHRSEGHARFLAPPRATCRRRCLTWAMPPRPWPRARWKRPAHAKGCLFWGHVPAFDGMSNLMEKNPASRPADQTTPNQGKTHTGRRMFGASIRGSRERDGVPGPVIAEVLRAPAQRDQHVDECFV